LLQHHIKPSEQSPAPLPCGRWRNEDYWIGCCILPCCLCSLANCNAQVFKFAHQQMLLLLCANNQINLGGKTQA
jgi:hypothetical protein